MLTIIALVIALLFLSWPWNVVIVIAAAAVDIAETGVFVWWSRRRRRRGPAAVGAETLVGRTGIALARLAPGAAARRPGAGRGRDLERALRRCRSIPAPRSSSAPSTGSTLDGRAGAARLSAW